MLMLLLMLLLPFAAPRLGAHAGGALAGRACKSGKGQAGHGNSGLTGASLESRGHPSSHARREESPTMSHPLTSVAVNLIVHSAEDVICNDPICKAGYNKAAGYNLKIMGSTLAQGESKKIAISIKSVHVSRGV
eukprot:1161156-Pelagomonas_calceolata.AAC.5